MDKIVKTSVWSKHNKNLVLILSLFLLIVMGVGNVIPSYTRLAVVFLIIPSLFFLFATGECLEARKLFIVAIMSILMVIMWDTVAIRMNIWNFPKQSVSVWILGIPLEEYIFAVGFPISVIGIYNALSRHKRHRFIKPHFDELPLILISSIVPLVTYLTFFFSDVSSYIKWLLFFTGLPVIFNLYRKGEKIDETRLFITLIIILIVTFGVDSIFIMQNAWTYNSAALLGKIGLVPIDDLLFAVFVSITVIGLYTSLPSRHLITGDW